ncbi:hypothetical protein LDENG_00235030, partial [Lucifuga dentata]
DNILLKRHKVRGGRDSEETGRHGVNSSASRLWGVECCFSSLLTLPYKCHFKGPSV